MFSASSLLFKFTRTVSLQGICSLHEVNKKSKTRVVRVVLDWRVTQRGGSGGIRTHAPEETGASNQKIGNVGFGASKDFEKRLVWIKKSFENQVNTLIYSIGEEADDIKVSFGLTADDATQCELVKNRFESHFIVKRNIIFERAKFNLRSQQEGESVETFITDLHCFAELCE